MWDNVVNKLFLIGLVPFDCGSSAGGCVFFCIYDTWALLSRIAGIAHVNNYLQLGSVHYLYPGLVPKRNGLGKPFFWSVKGWVISFLGKLFSKQTSFSFSCSVHS